MKFRQDKFLEAAFFRILDKTLNIEDLSVKAKVCLSRCNYA